MKIKKNDNILIIKGKDKGKQAKVLRVFPDAEKLIVEGANLAKKHVRPKKSGEKGQIVEIPKPLSAANVKLVCPKCGQPSRIGFKLMGNDKVRICKKCNQEI